MRISDWSSDVCSSDLRCRHAPKGASPNNLSTHCEFGRVGDAALALELVDPRVDQRDAFRMCEAAAGFGHHRAGIGDRHAVRQDRAGRSEEHTSELQSLMRISYAVFCLQKKNKKTTTDIRR